MKPCTKKILICLILLTSCNKVKDSIDDLLTFQIIRTIDRQTIAASLVPCQAARTLDISLFDIDEIEISQEQDFPEQNTETRLISAAHLSKLGLTLTADSGETNWDWLDSVSIYIQAEGQSKNLFANLDPVAQGVSEIMLQPENLNIAPYLKANGGFRLTTEATGCPPSNSATFEGLISLDVTASPL